MASGDTLVERSCRGDVLRLTDGGYADRYFEENNNIVIAQLSRELSKTNMGSVAAKMKKASNVCMESCVFSGTEDGDRPPSGDGKRSRDAEPSCANANIYETDYQSDEFEEVQSDDDVVTIKAANTAKSEDGMKEDKEVVLSQRSASTTAIDKRRSRPPGGLWSPAGYRTTDRCAPAPQTRRRNMSFTNERLRNIERENNLLLSKILNTRKYNRKTTIPSRTETPPKPIPAVAAILRKRQQEKIQYHNLILLRKIQDARSTTSCYNIR